MRNTPLKGMLDSKLGYKRYSPDRYNKLNIIRGDEDGTDLTMEDVDFKVRAEDNKGNVKIMKPGVKNYKFPGDIVIETKV